MDFSPLVDLMSVDQRLRTDGQQIFLWGGGGGALFFNFTQILYRKVLQ